MEERTRERVPLDWAQTENNLGDALGTLGERESGITRLEEAVTAYRAALEERTRERVPLDWAASFGDQGVILMLIAVRTNDITGAEIALMQIERAYQTTLRAGGQNELSKYFETQLAQARVTHDRLVAATKPRKR